MKKHVLLLTLFFCNVYLGFAQFTDGKFKHLFTLPASYVIPYTKASPTIDGNINDAVWKDAVWTDYFQDIEGDLKAKPYYTTKVKMLWDDQYLYIAAELEEEHIWANLTERDQIVFFDNDFEVFIDPDNTGHRYFEYEINALNTMFDLFLPKTYRSGSGALISWDSNRLKHAVQIYGSLNDPSDKDKSWTVEMAIPFKDITIGNNAHLPKDGDIWRLNFSRVQWETEIIDGKYVKKKGSDGKNLPENNWVWSPQGIIDMHAPERWGYIQFSKAAAGQQQPNFILPYSEKQRQYLWLVYYTQHEYRRNNKHFAKSLKELGLKEAYTIDGKENNLSMESSFSQFSATVATVGGKVFSISNEGYVN